MSRATIVGISGSLRTGSLNAALLRVGSKLTPPNTRVDVCSIRGIPLFDQDMEERDGLPQAVTELKEKMASACGVLIVTPEYNGGVPGVMKNAIDWLTRPWQDARRVFGRPVALLSASALPSGGASARAALQPVLKALGARMFERQFSVPSAVQAFDQDGTLKDREIETALGEFMRAFVAFTSNPTDAFTTAVTK